MSKRNRITDMFNVRKTKHGRTTPAPGKAAAAPTARKPVLAAPKPASQVVVAPSKDPKREAPREETVASRPAAEEPKVDIESFKYRKELARLEAKDRRVDTMPFATFETVHYEPRGVSEDTLKVQFGKSPRELFNGNPNNCKVYQFVRDNFEIPETFDHETRFGAKSGMCHEERVCSAYEDGKLEPKDPSADHIKMCRTCGEQGHYLFNCPRLLEGL